MSDDISPTDDQHDTTTRFIQRIYRIRRDDGDQVTATWYDEINRDIEAPLDTILRVRIAIERRQGTTHVGQRFSLQFRLNQSRFFPLRSTTPIREAESPFIINFERTTQQIIPLFAQLPENEGEFVSHFIPGNMMEVSETPIVHFTERTVTEHEWVLLLDSAQLIIGDIIRLRVVRLGDIPLDDYLRFPDLAVVKKMPKADDQPILFSEF